MTNNENHKTNHKTTSLGFESDSNRLVAYAICRGWKKREHRAGLIHEKEGSKGLSLSRPLFHYVPDPHLVGLYYLILLLLSLSIDRISNSYL